MDRHAHRMGELSIKEKIGNPPAWMPKEGRKVWKHLTGLDQYREVLLSQHRSGFEHYCWLEARLKLDQGVVHEGENLKPLNASEVQTLHSIRMQHALYPGSASKVTIPQKPRENKWEVLKASIPSAKGA